MTLDDVAGAGGVHGGAARGPADIYSCLKRAQGFSQAIKAAGATEVVLRSTGSMGAAEEGVV